MDHDEVQSAHREFTASPRRLLAAVLAVSPQKFRLISARGNEMHFAFRVPSKDGYRPGEEILALITAGPAGSQLLVVHENTTMADPDERVDAAMENFLNRVQFAFDHPTAGEFAKRAAEHGG